MLEKYHYIKFYKYCKKILDDGVISDKELDDLEIHEARNDGNSIAFTFVDLIHQLLAMKNLLTKLNQ